jgi:hypothetical protein
MIRQFEVKKKSYFPSYSVDNAIRKDGHERDPPLDKEDRFYDVHHLFD